MILDAFLQFSDAQALTATAASTDHIDLGADGNIGIGEPMGVYVVVDVAADDTTGDETYVVGIEFDDNTGFSSATEVAQFSIPRGTAAGTKYFLAIPQNTDGEQFLRLNYTLGGTTPTVTVSAYLQPANMVQNNVLYPDNITIS